MALITMRQLLDHAAENDYALPAFNVNNLEYIQAAVRVPMPATPSCAT
jgi:fructose-bisphosphate aldolase, class II